MPGVAMFFLLVIAPMLAILIGCWGLEMIEEDLLGWVLLVFGIGYPPGAILCYRRCRVRLTRS
jgi:hypothetical protein